MTRLVVDPSAVIHLATEQIDVSSTHRLLAPTLLRSQVLSLLHESVARHEITASGGRNLLARSGKIKIRYLGDAVLRRRAWDLAETLGQASTYHAEYIALTQLQADALVTFDDEVARLAAGLVRVAGINELK